MYHVVWGSKLNTQRMLSICPGAKPVGASTLPARLTFKCGYAQPEYDPRSVLRVGVWTIDDDDEEALARYQNCRFEKVWTQISICESRGQWAFVYMINGRHKAPTDSYLDTMLKGYNEWGFDRSEIWAALAHLRENA